MNSRPAGGAVQPETPFAAQSGPVRVAVRLAGSAAWRALAAPGRGRVAGVFERSFYVESTTGDFACIGLSSIGAGPLNALCAHPPRPWCELLASGDPVAAAGGRVQVGARLALELQAAACWTPPPVTDAPTVQRLAFHLSRLRAALAGRWPAEGLAPLLAQGGPGARGDPLARALWDRAASPLECLRTWLGGALAGAGPATPPHGIECLLGLGPGLTPSGDDLLGAVLIALRTFGRPKLAARLANRLLPRALCATTALSAAHLRAAADGEGAAALHTLLSGLGSDSGWEPEPACHSLAALGHSSGWDLLAGVLLVAEAAVAQGAIV